MNECPSEESLRALLNGSLTALEAAAVEEHLLTCLLCEEQLQRLTENPTGEHWRRLLAEQPALAQPPPTPGAEEAGGTGPWTPGEGAVPELPVRIGRFAVRELLGEGVFGRVYRAYDEQLQRDVAVKVAKDTTLNVPQHVERFLREARAAAQLRHPHIVPLFDAGKEGANYYIAYAFIAGKTLGAALKDGEVIPWKGSHPYYGRAQIIVALAEALAYAHEQGIVHRDLKPANVMLDHKGQPMLMDFGLAARLKEAEKLTHEGVVLGTPLYMAPEQAGGQMNAVGPASDQYSLGVMFYEMLCGEPPFKGDVQAVMRQHVDTEPPRPRRRDPKIPLDLETICLKALNKKAGERYRGCGELAADLRRFLADEPIQARRAGPGERLVKWARHKPFQAAFTAAGLLLVALLLFIVWREAQDYRRKYEREIESAKYRKDSENEYVEARLMMGDRKWVDAQRLLAGIKSGLEAQPDVQAEDLQARVKQSLVIVEKHIQEDVDRKQAREQRLAPFQEPYHEAMFKQLPLTGLNLSEHRQETRTSARKALKFYGLDAPPDAPGRLTDQLERDRQFLTAEEFARLTSDCYGLLVIWAEVEAADQQDKNEPKEEARKRGRRALALLERAQRVGDLTGLRTQTYYVRKARYLALGGEEKDAPVLVDAAAPSRPTGALDWFLKGLESYHQADQTEEANQPEQFRDASDALYQAVKFPGDQYSAHYLQGLCQLRLGRWRDARTELTVCMNLRPDFPRPLVVSGFAASEQGSRFASQGELLLSKALRQGTLLKDFGEIWNAWRESTSDYGQALADLDQALAHPLLDDQALYVGLVNRGVVFIRQGEWAKAIADLEQAINVNEAAFQGYANLAQAYRGAGRHQDALAAITRAIECAPDRPELYVVRAKIQLNRKDVAAARADFEQAIAHEKDSKSRRRAETLVELGRLLLEQKQYEAALARFDLALKGRPDLLLTERFKAEALLELQRKEEAAAALDRYLAATHEPAAEVLQARGLLHAGKGQLAAAIDLYSAALRLNKKDTKTRGHRAWTYFENGANRLALADFEVCLGEQPNSADYLTGRASVRVRLGQLPEALDDAEAAEKQGPLADRLCYHLSCVYAQAAAQKELEARSGRNLAAERAFAHYEEKSLKHLNGAMEEQPEKDRARFWRERVEKDPALAPIRGGRLYLQLARKYGARAL
jgi:tetratricopeptide (TPR) repeat protein/tRNA A-37 threonylcarbamoyl transferase component Bud32